MLPLPLPSQTLSPRNPLPVKIGNNNLRKKSRARGAQTIRVAGEQMHEDASCMSMLQECTRARSLKGGAQVHADMIKRGLEPNRAFQSTLFNLYANCEDLRNARMVFDTSPMGDNLISWNSMIKLYSRSGRPREALMLFLDLLRSERCIRPDQFTLRVVIGDVRGASQLPLGMQLHSLSTKVGCAEQESVGTSLIRMYAACERIDAAFLVFEVVSGNKCPAVWNSMIARLVEYGFHEDALRFYNRMLGVGMEPAPRTLASLLKACAALDSILFGQVHSQIIVRGLASNEVLATGLLRLYVKCGGVVGLQIARQRIFEKMGERNVITWNCMIHGYSQLGYPAEALRLFRRMRRDEISPDKFTFPALLGAAAAAAAQESRLPQGFECVHACIVKTGLEADPFVRACLISMYSRNQNMEDAWLAFEDMHSEDAGVWSSIISACTKGRGEGETALRLFTSMLFSGVQPNPSIYSSLFTVCGGLSALEVGKQIHAHSLKCRDSVDVAAENSLVGMYSDCGCIVEAWRIFVSIENPNAISFNSMILALGLHGRPKEAVDLFRHMKLVGIRPDEITLLNLLSAFNHAGLVHEGLELFNSMEDKYGIRPKYRHHACIADMLARGGDVAEAVRWIHEMPFDPEPSLWRVVLGACGKHRNLRIGKRVAELLLELEPYEASNYIFLANVYARSGRWSEADRIRSLMEGKGIRREVAVSWIEIQRRRYTFRPEDRSHPLTEQIYDKLRGLIKEIREKGYVPDISYTLHHTEDRGRREESLYHHSEKLAFAFATLTSPPGSTIRIMKNLRVCGDCHSAFKYFSLITGTTIVLRDNCRFHHFSGGACSCGDYW